MPREAPEKLQTRCLGHHKPYQREEGQARPSTAGHIGSNSLPSFPWGPMGLTLRSEGGTAVLLSLAQLWGEPQLGQPLWLYPGPKTDPRCECCNAHKHALVLGHIAALPQGSFCTAGKPVVPAGALGLLEPAGSLCPQQEVGGKHRQPPQLPAPSKAQAEPSRSIALAGQEGLGPSTSQL